MTSPAPKKSDLGVRSLSAIVMITVAGTALWLGGWWFDVLVLLVASVGLVECWRLIARAIRSAKWRVAGWAIASVYFGYATWLLLQINTPSLILLIVGTVVLIDISAYFFGRTIGGPKIAPRISPSKTWAGLLGGVIGALIALCTFFVTSSRMHGIGLPLSPGNVVSLLPFAAFLAVLAQSGDFFESWLKRRAGLKDSSNLIPGHGGVFDRIDGLLPVAILIGSAVVFQYPHWLNR